jgi:hypothetical protein
MSVIFKYVICVFSFWFFIFNFSYTAPLDNIQTDSWIYDAIDYLKTTGYIKSIPPTSKPWSRQHVIELLQASNINNSYDNAQAEFYIKRLLAEFSDDLLIDFDILKQRPLFNLNYGPGDVLGDFSVRFAYYNLTNALNPHDYWLYPDNQTGSLDLKFNLNQNSKISLYNQYDITYRHNDAPDTWDAAGPHFPGTRIKSYSNHVTIDCKQAYLTFPLYFLDMEIGRDNLYFGPAYRGSVLLSDIAPSFDQIQLRAQKNNYKTLWFAAVLSPWYDYHRFLSGQRIEINIGKHMRVGGTMLVAYAFDSLQTRSFWGYLNPIIPIYNEVSNTGHDDNILFGFDLVAYLKHIKLYGQLMLDNFEFNQKPDSIRPPDCYGLTIGTYLPYAQFALRSEYSKVTRYTYHHRIYHIAYTQYSVPLGHALGPDADEIFVRLEYYPLRNLRTNLVATITRRGDGNRGDLDNRTWDADEEPIREFPSGNIITTTLFGPEIDFQLRNDLRILSGIYYNNNKDIESFIRLQYRY